MRIVDWLCHLRKHDWRIVGRWPDRLCLTPDGGKTVVRGFDAVIRLERCAYCGKEQAYATELNNTRHEMSPDMVRQNYKKKDAGKEVN